MKKQMEIKRLENIVNKKIVINKLLLLCLIMFLKSESTCV